MQKLKERINIMNVDTGDRSIEGDIDEVGVPIEEALSPFKIDRASLPHGYDKPNVPSPSNIVPQDSLQIFDSSYDKTTGESPFSSPRLLGEAEKEVEQEQPELKIIKEELKENRQGYIKTALGLGNIGTLEESWIERDDPDEP